LGILYATTIRAAKLKVYILMSPMFGAKMA